MKDVARAAGVSVGTVSNVLNRPERVSEALRERVHGAVRELGFVPNESARQLRSGVSRTVAVVVLDVGNPFFADVVAGVEEAAEELGALVTVASSGGSAEREARHLRHLAQQRVLGVLLTPVRHDRGAALELLRGHGTPVVLLDSAAGPDQHAVSVDDVHGGVLAGEHLVAQGHRRLGFVGGPSGLPQVDDRLRGLRAVAAAHRGRGVGDVLVVDSAGTSVRAGSQAAAQLLQMPAHERPTAVFCANDLLAIGVLNECLRQGVRVPHDVALVGYDDIGFAATTTVPLSSVRQPRELLGRTAVELLVTQLDDVAPARAGGHAEQGATPSPRHRRFEPDLVVRASSAARRPQRTSASA